MASDERPSKLRKLSHDNGAPGPDETIPSPAPAPEGEAAATPFPRNIPNPSSKNQLKKARRQAEWESQRTDRAAKRKLKTAAKKARQRAERDSTLAAAGLTIADYARQKAAQHTRPTQVPVTFVLDCGYDGLMRDGERISLASQITRAYGENRRAKWRGHVVVSSFGGKLRERFDGVLRGGYARWKGFQVFEEGFGDVAGRAGEWMRGEEGGELVGPFEGAEEEGQGETVYLSAEAEETLTELKPWSTYIVGGLVDKNREKGICYRAAKEAGIRTARLPIGEYLEMQSRKVLATNHVVEIMLKWLEYRDWAKAFLEVIPKRKGGALKGDGTVGKEGGVGEDDGEDDDGVEETEEGLEEEPSAIPGDIEDIEKGLGGESNATSAQVEETAVASEIAAT